MHSLFTEKLPLYTHSSGTVVHIQLNMTKCYGNNTVNMYSFIFTISTGKSTHQSNCCHQSGYTLVDSNTGSFQWYSHSEPNPCSGASSVHTRPHLNVSYDNIYHKSIWKRNHLVVVSTHKWDKINISHYTSTQQSIM